MKYESFVRRSRNGLHDDPAVVVKLNSYQRIIGMFFFAANVSNTKMCLVSYIHTIDKDCVRTDRHLEFYSNTSDANTKRLRDILYSFIVYDHEMGV